MMKTKHTPGPWELQVHDNGPYFTEVEIWQENYGMMARMPDNTSIWNSEKKEGVALEILEQTKANAKLIAAAPELLTACKLALQYIETGGLGGVTKKALNEAIKKATT